jgi:hypothetical protein
VITKISAEITRFEAASKASVYQSSRGLPEFEFFPLRLIRFLAEISFDAEYR